MMEQTIKSMARELAGAFYEQNRSERFRKAFPTVEHYLKGWQILADGVVKKIPAGWMHHVKLAREVLTKMLGMPDGRISSAMKERIYDALIEDRGKSLRFGQRITQRMERDDDKAQSRLRLN